MNYKFNHPHYLCHQTSSMKQLVILFLLAVTIGSCSRKEEEPTPVPINCDGLVTDTAGTGDNGRVYMPSAFSPNGDGLNDQSKPILQNISSFEFTIYDELNRVMFTTTQTSPGWQPVASGLVSAHYYYRIQANTSAGHHIGKCGSVYVLTCFPASIPRSTFYFEDQLTPFGFTGVTAETLSNCP